MTELPTITVITPSFNQAPYLEATLCSVLGQGYPRLEYMVFDGGSTDGSAEILRRYSSQLAYWVSQPDGGQAAAVNQGMARATGSLLLWINSDDLLLPGALAAAAAQHLETPEALLLGDVVHFNPADGLAYLVHQHQVCLENMVAHWRPGWAWNQPGTFMPRSVWQKVGPLDESLRYLFDREWMCRALAAGTPVAYLPAPVAVFRLHTGSKTMGEVPHWGQEQLAVTRRYAPLLPALTDRHIAAAHELLEATMRLSLLHLGSWNAPAARQHLRRAMGLQPGVVFTPQYWQLWLRALTPAPVLALARRQWASRRRQMTLPLSLTGDA